MIAVYGRVSTSNQENEGTIETQLSAVREYATKHGFVIVQEYLDQGWSGSTLIRPQLDQLRVDAKKGLWDAVLIYDPDRLARRFSYQELITDELKDAGIDLMYVTTATPENSEDRILFGVKGLFAEYERSKITERFRLGKLRKAKEGNIIMTSPPYGYDLILKQGSKSQNDFKHGYLKVNPFEARIVKMMFGWVANDGLTLRKLVTRLHEMGVKPKKSKRGVWSTSTLSTLLRNRIYVGEGHYGASYGVVPKNPLNHDTYKKNKKSSRKMRPKDEWIIIPTPKIVSEDLFERANERLRLNYQEGRRNRKNEYLLAGKIWCACNKRRAGEGPKNGKYLYYRCSSRVSSFPLKSTCRERGINARIADSLVWKNIRNLMTDDVLLNEQVERWRKNKSSDVDREMIDIGTIEREIKKLKLQEKRYDNAFGEGLLSLDQLKEYKEPIRANLETLNEQLHRSQQRAAAPKELVPPTPGEIDEFVQRVKSKVEGLNFTQRKAIVDKVVESIVGSQKQLFIKGHLPFSESLYSRLCSNNDFGNGEEAFNSNQNNVKFRPYSRNDTNIIQHADSEKRTVPFEINVVLPPPLQRGIDYGFKK